ncbi:hypothetical protein LTR04_004996 [Oleoguttula sp. CCFEE 6159]|nr:hypothetical protein LTR04_004996 [Oleoguttula sp. CCFEE 6159]
MHTSTLFASSLSLLATLATAEFHIYAQNAGTDINDTLFFVLGSSGDSNANQCSLLNNGKFGTSTVSIGSFGNAQQLNHGLGLLDAPGFVVTGVCGIDNAHFKKQSDGSYRFTDDAGDVLGVCQLSNAQTADCVTTVGFGSQQVKTGAVTDIMRCQATGEASFCDPAVGPSKKRSVAFLA